MRRLCSARERAFCLQGDVARGRDEHDADVCCAQSDLLLRRCVRNLRYILAAISSSTTLLGTSVTVGCLIETNTTQAEVAANRSWDLLISVDNKTTGSFLLNQSIGTTASLDNVMVYSSSPLPMGNHTVEIFGAVPVNDSDTSKPLVKQSVVVLDYIQYT